MCKLLILVSWTLFLSGVQSVCNTTALTNVTIDAYFDRQSNRKHFINYNINDLNNYYKLDVIDANITTICSGMIRNFVRLHTLSMIRLNISDVESNGFLNVSSLENLALSLNNLVSVKRGQYNNIPYLKRLFLSGNIIEYVEENALSDMPYLEDIYLDRNKMKYINGEWFLNSPRIKTVNLAFNELTQITDNAFKNLLPLHYSNVEYHLEHNQIKFISDSTIDTRKPLVLHLEHNNIDVLTRSTFANLKLVNRLYLDWNNITCLDDGVISEMRTSTITLHLNNNPLTCQCILEWKNEGITKELATDFYYSSTNTCLMPKIPKLPGNPWGDLYND